MTTPATARSGLPKTRDLVRHYAGQLLEAGAEVSVTAIRARILEEHGVSASPNVVGDEVKQFWARTGPLLNARLKRPGIPEAVGQALDAVWDVALNEATAAYAIERSHYQEQAERAQREAAEAQVEAEQATGRFADQERQIALLTEQVQRLHAQLDRAQAGSEALRQELGELTAQHRSLDQRHRDELARIDTTHGAEQERLAETHAAELARLQAVHQAENAALRAEVSRQADIFEGTANHLMQETSRVRDAVRVETERLTRELSHSRDLVERLRVQRSDAKEEAAGYRAQVDSLAAQLQPLQKAHERLEARHEALLAAKAEGQG
ncbi:DNA-binding protein [Pseudomonas massiliensis]|uniref:DNA-binding protein n=1 Tax=Pseudomonas massiliensis TaxID=522492 RepID=UPI000693F576|nr:DNA-binding protein [Pseudomonas massiliensis]